MSPRSAKYLEDIRQASAFIIEVTRGKTREEYLGDRVLRFAVERNFEIIGEALRRLARDDPATAGRVSDYPQVIAFRNLLTHGYDLVDDAFVWSVVQNQLPTLHEEVISLLKIIEGAGS